MAVAVRLKGDLVQRVALAAAELDRAPFRALVESLVVEALPVDGCTVAVGPAAVAKVPAVDGARSVPIIVRGRMVGSVVVWRNDGPVALSAAEQGDLAAVAAVIGLAERGRVLR